MQTPPADAGYIAPPAAEPVPPAPAMEDANPFSLPETAPAEPEFTPLDFSAPVFAPDPSPSSETQDEEEQASQDTLATLGLPENWRHGGDLTSPDAPAEPAATDAVEEPQFTPFDFTPTVPLADADVAAEDHAETQEEPLFSPMPMPGRNAFLPLESAVYTEGQEEPFFPLPPLGENPLLTQTTEEPTGDAGREDAGAGGVEEPHFLGAEPLASTCGGGRGRTPVQSAAGLQPVPLA